VKFARPASNGTSITHYTATCTSSNGRPGSQTGPKSPITVSGLTNGRIYTCRVAAANAVGSGPRSAPSAPVVTGAAPAAPRIVSVVSGKAPGPTGPLLVSFKAGSNNGTPISSYRVRCIAVSDGSVHVNSSTGTPITVPGLITGHAYTCSVVAISASGTSGSSAALTTKVGTPAMPRITATTAHGHGLTMTFIVPSNNGNLILHYHAVCKSTNGGATAGQFARGSPFAVNALTPGGLYTCQLSAVNSRGEGPAATSSQVRVPF
jgi:large repetitive protein